MLDWARGRHFDTSCPNKHTDTPARIVRVSGAPTGERDEHLAYLRWIVGIIGSVGRDGSPVEREAEADSLS